MAAMPVVSPAPLIEEAPARVRHQRSTRTPFGVAGRARYSEHRPLRVLVVDSQEIVYLGFRLLLTDRPWVERCLLASRLGAAVELARRYEPHVALVDMSVSESSGPQISAALRAAHPGIKIVLMTHGERLSTPMALAAGACGVVSKSWPTADLATAVRMVGMGMTLFARQTETHAFQLSRREGDVIALIAAGATNREIGGQLHLSPNTVKQHTSTLYRKLEVRNRAAAVRKAQQLGLIC